MKHPRRPSFKQASRTGWEPVAQWYDRYLSGPSTFQREIIFPHTLRLLAPERTGRYLDLACGQGALTHLIAKKAAQVVGLDASPSLIEQAQKQASKNEIFIVGDATHCAETLAEPFDGGVCILAIQNIASLDLLFREISRVLKIHAPFVVVMNHPCFRQPSQSGWGWDEQRKLQYRRVDRYLSEFETPILAHPGADRSIKTYSFHRPLQTYVTAMTKYGFLIDALEEWTSHKTSDSGPRAKAENIARAEIPLFLAIRGRKQSV